MHLLIKIGCLYRFDMLTEALNYMLTVKGFLPVIATVGSLAVGLEILVCYFLLPIASLKVNEKINHTQACHT